MQPWLADPPFFGGPGQGTRQIIELFVAFGLTSLIGLEREIQGKSAGVRTQTIVGTAAGSGLLLLAVTVTAMHFLIIVGFMPLAKRLSARVSGSVTMHGTYEEGRGVRG